MSDLQQWVGLWEREPKLQPPGTYTTSYKGTVSLLWGRKSVGGVGLGKFQDALIRDAAVQFLLSLNRGRSYVRIDTNKGDQPLMALVRIQSMQTGYDVGDTVLDALYAACARLLDERESAAASGTSQEPTHG